MGAPRLRPAALVLARHSVSAAAGPGKVVADMGAEGGARGSTKKCKSASIEQGPTVPAFL
eukprot:6151610-Pyramimonas_sp.AAC.1